MGHKSRKKTKPAVKSKGKRCKLGWGQSGKNHNTLVKIEKANFDEKEI